MTNANASMERPHDDAVETFIRNRLSALRGETASPEAREFASITPTSRRAILAFLEAKEGEVGRLHFRNYVAWLPVAASRLGKSFLSPGLDIQAQFNYAFPAKSPSAKGYSFFSRQTVGSILMGFWRYRLSRAGKPFPDHLRLRFGKWKSPYNGSDMLTRDEVAAIAENAQNFRDKAWIWTLFNSGCRPGEVYMLRVGDVVPHDEGYIELRLTREKDSAPEPAPVYEDAVPALLAWLNAHPLRDQPTAPLWVGLGGSRIGKPATYRAMYKALESAARRAKVAKPVTAYALRRSRLTQLAKDPAISTSILEKVAGWAPGSRVARHYVHLSGKDVINALNARYGVKGPGPGDRSETPRTPLKCGRCRTVNPAGAVYCMTCGGPLSLPAVKQIEEARVAEERLAELLRQPEAVEFLARLLADQGKGRGRSGGRRAMDAGNAPTDGPATDPRGAPLLITPKSDRATAPPPERVVPLSDAERLIGSGCEFVAALGPDKVVLRPAN